MQVPDTNIRELLLEVEVSATAVMDYRPAHAASALAAGGLAWEPAAGVSSSSSGNGGGSGGGSNGVDFCILRLDHKMRGNSIPLPKTLLK